MAALRGRRLAVPGRLTTANLLLQLYGEGFGDVLILPFHRIMAAVAAGEVDAGVIIHESRFTFRRHGLVEVCDLGAWWERETGHPIPLGGILARRSLGSDTISRIDAALRESVEYAFSRPEEPKAYIRRHAQEIDDRVIEQHIALYVNDFTRDLGAQGEGAVAELLRRAEARGLIPTCELPLFAA
jgi:1,4-dihydroxy-6-naphthoate synthase